LFDLGAGEVHFATAFEVAGFSEVVGEGAGEEIGGVFEGVFGGGFLVGGSSGCAAAWADFAWTAP